MPGTSPGMTNWRDGVRRYSPDLPQHRFDRLALVRRQGCLRRKRVADVITLNRKSGLDAGRQIVARKGFVDAAQSALQRQRFVPARGLAEIIQLDALPRN